jgi:hypothetical protein
MGEKVNIASIIFDRKYGNIKVVDLNNIMDENDMIDIETLDKLLEQVGKDDDN